MSSPAPALIRNHSRLMKVMVILSVLCVVGIVATIFVSLNQRYDAIAPGLDKALDTVIHKDPKDVVLAHVSPLVDIGQVLYLKDPVPSLMVRDIQPFDCNVVKNYLMAHPKVLSQVQVYFNGLPMNDVADLKAFGCASERWPNADHPTNITFIRTFQSL